MTGEEPRRLGDHFLVTSAGLPVEIDPLHGGPLSPSIWAMGPMELAPLDTASNDVWVGTRRGADTMPAIVGIDPRSAGLRWKAECTTTCDVPGSAVRVGNLVVIEALFNSDNVDLFAIDVTTGRETWRTTLHDADALGPKLAADSSRAFALTWAGVDAFDVATGTKRWHTAFKQSGMTPIVGVQIAAADGRVVYAEPAGDLCIASSSTGTILHRIPIAWEGTVGDLLIRDGAIYAFAMRGGMGDATQAVAIDLATGDVLWRYQDKNSVLVPPVRVDPNFFFVLAAHEPYLNDVGTEVIALARTTGEVRWRRGLGRARAIALASTAGGAPVVIADTMGREVLAFTPQPPAGPVEVTISGSVVTPRPASSLADLRVSVGDTVVKTDPRGHYSASVSARGIVKVMLLDLPPMVLASLELPTADPDFVTVDKDRKAYSADLNVRIVQRD